MDAFRARFGADVGFAPSASSDSIFSISLAHLQKTRVEKRIKAHKESKKSKAKAKAQAGSS